MAITYDDNERVRTLTNAVYLIMAEGGPGALTLRRVAACSGVSAGSILNHFGSKDRALAVCTFRISADLLDSLRERVRRRGGLGFAPIDADDVVDARVWLGLCELARCHERVAPTVSEHRRTQLHLLACAVGHSVSPTDLMALLSCFDGLDHAVTALRDPLPSTLARAVAERTLDRLAPAWREVAAGPRSHFETWAALSRSA